MKTVFKALFWLVCILAGLSSTWICPQAQAGEVSALVDRNQVTLGESLELSVTIEGGDGEVDIEGIKDFKVVSRGTSSNFEFINGRSSRKIIHTYVLVPLRAGNLTIPALPVTIDGKRQLTKPIIIQVEKGSAAKEGSDDVFIKAHLSNSTPYVGEQVICTFSLYNAVQITNAQFQKPDFKGFDAKELDNQNSHRTIINGREFVVRDLVYILIPQVRGPQTIEPADIQLNVVRADRRRRGQWSPFDDFFGRTRMEPRFLRSDALHLTVKPLPPAPPSIVSSGLVGQFNLSAKIERQDLKVGDSVTLTLTLDGRGNLVDAPEVRPSVPENFKHYDDSPQEDIKLTAQGYEGKKIFRTALVPVKAGEYQLPPVTLTYFDVEKGQYQTIATQPIQLRVVPSASVTAQPSQPSGLRTTKPRSEVTFTGRDILPLNEELDALTHQAPLTLTAFLLWLMLPAGCFLGTLLIRKQLNKGDGLQKRMARRTRKLLKTAATIDPQEKEYLALLYRALVSAIRTRSETQGESLTWAEAQTLLMQKGCSEALSREASELLEAIETASYGGDRADDTMLKELLNKTQSLAGRLVK